MLAGAVADSKRPRLMSDSTTILSTPDSPKTGTARDLVVKGLPPLNWESGQVSDSLTQLRDYAVELVEESIQWYRGAKRPMMKAGRGLRFVAIIFGAVAGMIPVLAELITVDGSPLIDPLWSAIAIGLSATLVLVDKFYGCTSAWVRYLQAELDLQVGMVEPRGVEPLTF